MREQPYLFFQLTLYRPAMPFGNRKIILEDLSIQYCHDSKTYYPSGNLKFTILDIFQSLKVRLLMKKVLPISFKLNLTANPLGCYMG